MEVTAIQVKELRDKTNAGFMDCKAALKESGGDVEKAIEFLRKKGMATAEKKAGRQTSEGVVASCIREDGSAGVLIELNCETDFVARNSQFKEFVDKLVRFVADAGSTIEKAGDLPPECGEWITGAVAKLGENISFSRGVRFELAGPGLIASYIHLGSRVGVLVEVGCGDSEAASNDVFKNLVKDITLQIASSSPDYLTREDIPPEVIRKESEIVAATLKKVPDAQRDRAIEGKLRKTLYAQRVLMDQIFVRPPSDKTIAKLIEEKAKEIGQPIEVRRFARFQVGEEL